MWKEADMSGDRWKSKDDFVMFFIYTLSFTVSLASKNKRKRLRAIYPHCHSVPYSNSAQ